VNDLSVIKELGFVKDDGQEYDIDEILDVLDIETRQIRGMFADYECAAMEIETKFKVLNLQFSSDSNRNPIETIKTRIKTMPSILRKLQRRNIWYIPQKNNVNYLILLTVLSKETAIVQAFVKLCVRLTTKACRRSLHT